MDRDDAHQEYGRGADAYDYTCATTAAGQIQVEAHPSGGFNLVPVYFYKTAQTYGYFISNGSWGQNCGGGFSLATGTGSSTNPSVPAAIYAYKQ